MRAVSGVSPAGHEYATGVAAAGQGLQVRERWNVQST